MACLTEDHEPKKLNFPNPRYVDQAVIHISRVSLGALTVRTDQLLKANRKEASIGSTIQAGTLSINGKIRSESVLLSWAVSHEYVTGPETDISVSSCIPR